jgi:tetratricopeptide (TPR) repeat protein
VVIKEIIDIKKDNYILWQQLLYNASVLQKHDDVINYGNEALQYFPNKKELNLFIGISLFQKEDYHEAYNRLKSGYRDDMDKPVRLQFLTFIAESAFKIQLIDSAFAAFDKILHIDPENYSIMNNYSYYLALHNRDLKKAEVMSKQTIINEPENATYLDTYGWVLFVSGRYADAEKYLKLAVAGSDDPDVLFHYAEVLNKLGKKIEAETYYLKAIEAGLENKEILEKIEGRNE